VLGRNWPNQPSPIQKTGAHTTVQLVLQKSPYRFKNQKRSPRHYSRVSLTFTLRSSVFCFFSKTNSGNDALAADHLVAHTGHDRRQLPKLTNGQALQSRGKPRTSLNWTNTALDSPDHGDGEYRIQIKVLRLIECGQAQRAEPMSITSMCGAKTWPRRARADLETVGHGARRIHARRCLKRGKWRRDYLWWN
jgi:hypothetical protein